MQFVVGMDKAFSNKAGVALEKMKKAGVTSVETYVLWKDIEGAGEGRFDFSLFDEDLTALKEKSLKWVPFLVIGPWYSTPEWFLRSEKSVPSVCLEHNKQGGNQSIWSPFLKDQVKRTLKAFLDHYKGETAIESVLVGISGDYGEAIQTVYGNWPGEYHGHRGYWAGDAYAVESFRNFLLYHYDSLANINYSWGTHYSWEEVRPFMPTLSSAPSRKALLDFHQWYKESMTSWADWWLTQLDNWPWDVYLVTGGNDEPEHASSFAEQCRVTANHKRGIRITNEASDYTLNFMLTRLVSTASRKYGSYFSTEPASSVNEKGEVGRVYNAYSSGARAFHEYFYNLFQDIEGNEKPNLRFLPSSVLARKGDEKPVVSVGLVTSQNTRILDGSFGEEELNASKKIRELTDFDLLNEDLLSNGSIDYRFLIFAFPFMAPENLLSKLVAWIQDGGTAIIAYPPKNLDGDSSTFKSLLGIEEEVIGVSEIKPLTRLGTQGVTSRAYKVSGDAELHAVMSYKESETKAVVWSRKVEKGKVLAVSSSPSSRIFTNALRECLYGSLIGVEPLQKPYEPIPIEGIYPAATEDHLILYNSTDKQVKIKIKTGEAVLEPNSISMF